MNIFCRVSTMSTTKWSTGQSGANAMVPPFHVFYLPESSLIVRPCIYWSKEPLARRNRLSCWLTFNKIFTQARTHHFDRADTAHNRYLPYWPLQYLQLQPQRQRVSLSIDSYHTELDIQDQRFDVQSISFEICQRSNVGRVFRTNQPSTKASGKL